MTFNSQPHTRLTLLKLHCYLLFLSFNSQPHTRLTSSRPLPFLHGLSFNSQPHTRLTSAFRYCRKTHKYFQFTASYEADPSTHTISPTCLGLSIHSLIRGWPRHTRTPFYSVFFQFTASYEADLFSAFLSLPCNSFNSQPHTRLTSEDKKKAMRYCLSIHSLIRGWPERQRLNLVSLHFQFTASYEADPSLSHGCIPERPFNSQPHTRLTQPTLSKIDESCSFNSQPHTRLTKRSIGFLQSSTSFNSQPHTRLTTHHLKEKLQNDLSIHSLIRGWPKKGSGKTTLICLSIHSLIRGWPSKPTLQHYTTCPFNSQPHTRLTWKKMGN